MYGQVLEHVFIAFQYLISLEGLLFLTFGVVIGCIFGSLPGLGGIQAIVLLFPITFTMTPENAILLLMGIVGATAPSGAVTAILLNTPGTPENVAHTFEGFPMTQQNRAGIALGANASASLLGALVGVIVPITLLPFGRYVVLAFSYPEYFMLGMIGITAIALLSHGKMWKGLISGLLGLIIASVGYDPVTAEIRYTFGIQSLHEGISLIAVMIGLFAIAQAMEFFMSGGSIVRDRLSKINIFKGITEGMLSTCKHFNLFFRTSILGTIIGIIPGIGGSVANFLAYGHAVGTTKNKESYGKGDVRGIIAVSAADNAKDGGALVPTLLFGIPGSAVMAVVITVLVIHNVNPGPRLMIESPQIVFLLAIALAASNVLSAVICMFLGGAINPLTRVSSTMIAPIIIVFSLLGAFVTRYNFIDVSVAITFGVLGYCMTRLGFPKVPLIIAVVLGTQIQMNFHQTLRLFGPEGFVTRPLSLTMLLMVIAILIIPALKVRKKREA